MDAAWPLYHSFRHVWTFQEIHKCHGPETQPVLPRTCCNYTPRQQRGNPQIGARATGWKQWHKPCEQCDPTAGGGSSVTWRGRNRFKSRTQRPVFHQNPCHLFSWFEQFHIGIEVGKSKVRGTMCRFRVCVLVCCYPCQMITIDCMIKRIWSSLWSKAVIYESQIMRESERNHTYPHPKVKSISKQGRCIACIHWLFT